MHRKRRKNNLVWLFALLGILVLFLGTILAFLIFSNLSSKPTETVQEVSAVNGTGIVLPSHFTERKITDPSTARDAINDVADAEMEQLYLMPGEERYTKFQDENGVPKVRYTYCSLHGRLFNCTCKTMDEAQRLCEDWLVTQDRCYIN